MHLGTLQESGRERGLKYRIIIGMRRGLLKSPGSQVVFGAIKIRAAPHSTISRARLPVHVSSPTGTTIVNRVHDLFYL